MRVAALAPPFEHVLTLIALSGLGIAIPLLLMIEPQFFISRGVEPFDVVLLVLALILLPPLVLYLIEAAAGLVHRRLAHGVHLAAVALLAAILASIVMFGSGLPYWLHGLVALAAGAGGAVLYARSPGTRSLLRYGAVLPVLVGVYVLVVSPMSSFVFAGAERPQLAPAASGTPVVVIVMDELPGFALMDRRGRLDRERYPGFAQLAAGATWFPNATATRSDSELAVPGIATGLRPALDTVPTAQEYPRSIFTLFGRSHSFNVEETWTDLCPERLCPHTSLESRADRIGSFLDDLPFMHARLSLPGADELGLPRPRESRTPRREQFARWLARIGRSDEPTLNFLHVMLPHRPWRHLADGRRYSDRVGKRPWLSAFTRWPDDEWQVTQGRQRFLLQLGYTDRLIGQFVSRLRETGLWNRSLVVVTADHGLAFDPGGETRDATPENAAEIMSVPLFVKPPGQRRGRVDRRFAQSVDILATVADGAGATLPWSTEGHSLLSGTLPDRRLEIENKRGGGADLSEQEFATLRDAALERQVAEFGDGNRAALYRIGPHRGLLGARASGDPPRIRVGSPIPGASVDLTGATGLAAYDPDSYWVPARIGGTVEGLDAGAAVAVALNGRIAATTRTYAGHDGETEVAAIVDHDRVLHRGRNQLELFAIEPEPDGAELRPIETDD